MKKILSLILAVLMVIGILVIPTGAATTITLESGWNGSTASAPQGSGTSNDPYLISSPEHLQWMSNLLSGKQFLATNGYNGQLWHPTYTKLPKIP